MVKPLINQNPFRGVSILRIIDLGGQHAPDYSKRRGQHLPDWQLLFHYFYVSGSGGQLSPEYP
ncbi:MAG: hypothetical protein JJU34_05365, partial [Lunatimonas sp.]|uniref:hypothetical protein n=1 Tax=Lunatimonas sp. TaxID=2060141 RepID=UPI00263AAD29